MKDWSGSGGELNSTPSFFPEALLTACLSPAAAGEPGTDREKTSLEDRFNHLRPEVLDTLSKLFSFGFMGMLTARF